MVTSEQKISVRKNGQEVEKWVKKSSHINNHYLDCEVYAAVAADILGVRALHLQDEEAPKPKNQQPKKTEEYPEEQWISQNELSSW